MTAGQIVLAALTLLVSIASATLAYWIGVANSMSTVPQRLSRPQLGVIAVSWLAAAVLMLAAVCQAERTTSVLLWHAPAVLILVVAVRLGLGDLLGHSEQARERRRQRYFDAERVAMQRIWEQHGRREAWQLRVERGLAGSYLDSRQTQRPGVEWMVAFKVDAQPHTVTVRSLGPHPGDDGQWTEADLITHARAALDALEAKLDAGWRPDPRGEVIFVEP